MLFHQPAKRDQLGFSVIEVLLVALFVAVLTVTGFVVYQRHKTTSAKNSAATSQTQTATQPAHTTTQYLDIKEWGIKLPLSDSIKDAYYIPGISSKGSDGLTNQMWIGLKTLDGNGCTATKNSGPALLFRALPTETDGVTGQLLTKEYPNGVTIGSYFYAYEDFTSSISNTCKAPQTTLQTVNSALVTAAKGVITATDPNYLVIKEWGIKVKLADADKITYTIGGNPNSSSANADAIVSWATLKLNSSVNTSDKCRSLGYEVEQLLAATNAAKIGKYDYGFSGTYDPCGDSTVDQLRAKITGTELESSAITAE